METWEKVLIILVWSGIAFSDIRRTLKTYKDFNLVNGNLIVCETFSKENRYDLKNVSNWAENYYYILGFRTGREIIIKMNNNTIVILFDRKTKKLEILSKYLNDNLPQAYENQQ